MGRIENKNKNEALFFSFKFWWTWKMVCIQSRLQNLLIILTSRARCQTGPILEWPCGLYSQGFTDRDPNPRSKCLMKMVKRHAVKACLKVCQVWTVSRIPNIFIVTFASRINIIWMSDRWFQVELCHFLRHYCMFNMLYLRSSHFRAIYESLTSIYKFIKKSSSIIWTVKNLWYLKMKLENFKQTMKQYFEYMEACDRDGMLGLFAENAQIQVA